MGEKEDTTFFRWFSLVIGLSIFVFIWLIYFLRPFNPVEILLFLFFAGIALQSVTLQAKSLLIEKEYSNEFRKKEFILHQFLLLYALIWVMVWILFHSFMSNIVKEPIGSVIIAIFIIFFGIDKISTQRKKHSLSKPYKLWVTLESAISLVLGGIILCFSLFAFTVSYFLMLASLSLAASSNVFLAFGGIKQQKL